MKKLLLLLPLLVGVHFATAQRIVLSSQKLIKVYNDLGFTHTFILQDKNKVVQKATVPPNGYATFSVKISRSTVKNYTVWGNYDVASYRNDLQIIKNQYAARERARQERIITEAILRGLDQYFLNGGVFEVVDKSKLAVDLINGKDIDQWTEEVVTALMEEKVIDEIDDKAAKAVAASTFALKGLLQEKSYGDLDRAANTCLDRLKSGYKNRVRLVDKVKKYPKYEMSLEGTMPLGVEYTYLASENPTYGDFVGDLMPYSVRLVSIWKFRDSRGGFMLPVGFSQSPIMYKAREPDATFPYGVARSFNHIDLAFGYHYRLIGGKKVGVDFNIEIGARANFINTYSYQEDGQGLTSILTTESFKYDQFNPLFHIGGALDFRYFKLIGRYSNTVPVTNTDTNTTTNLKASYYQVGVAIPFIRNYDFTTSKLKK